MLKHLKFSFVCLFIISTLAACSQPVPATLPAPSTTPIPGWKELTGGGAGLWVPDSFDGGGLSAENLKLMIQQLDKMGPDFATLARTLEKNPGIFLIYAFDTNENSGGGVNTINITSEIVPPTVTLERFLDATIKQLPPIMNVISRSQITLDGKPAGKMIVTMETLGAKEVIYVFRSGGSIYAVTYATSAADFDSLAGEFELSAKTFYVIP